MSITRYCVVSGVNHSHLHDVKWFTRLKDARAAVAELPPAPHGAPRPYRIERHWYRSTKTHHAEEVSIVEANQ